VFFSDEESDSEIVQDQQNYQKTDQNIDQESDN
jgi:hypothetical protein